jgi:glycosyltransferase involved in cell wall biosynthesis
MRRAQGGSMTGVDVVIPAFNAAPHLREAIDSVLAQSRRPARVIVVDDASTDATASIARELGAPVELLVHDANRGAAAARNTGIAAATAPLVAFLDADDRWTPDKLERQCAALDASPATTFALCRIREFLSDELDEAERAAIARVDSTQVEGWTASALVARRALFAECGGFDETLRIGEAIDWFSRARSRPHVHLDFVGVERRLHRDNSTRRASVTAHDYLAVVRRHMTRQRGRQR